MHWELFAKDALALGTFYSDLFEWTLRPLPDIGYVLVDTRASTGVNGGIATVPDGSRQPMFYLRVDDLQLALHSVEKAGGATTLRPITKMVSFAQFADPDGNVVGLLKHGDESPVSRGEVPPVSCFHVRSTNPAGLVEFYRAVFGWETQPSDVPSEGVLFRVETGHGGIAGTIGCSSPGTSPVTF